MLIRVSRQIAIICTTCLVACAVWAQQTNIVADLAITGNQNINMETIRSAIGLKAGDEFKEDAAEKDKAAIMSLGYFSAVTLHRDVVPGGLKLTFEVTENPKITDILVTGSDPIPAEKVLEVMKTKPGQVLNTTTLDQDLQAIQSYYAEERYLCFITSDVGVDAATGTLTIPIIVSKVESIDILDSKKTKPYVFLRECDQAWCYLTLGCSRRTGCDIWS